MVRCANWSSGDAVTESDSGQMKIAAIIPARSGSKGIPGKNIRRLAGRPLLAYSIEQARNTPGIDRVFVSTDGEEIAAVARQEGAEVIQRPAELSGDRASSESALRHALDYLRDEKRYEPDWVVFLQATSPLRQPDDIQRALMVMRDEGADSLLSVGPLNGFVWRSEGGMVRAFSYDHTRRPRRQDAPEDLIENGSIYIFRPAILREFDNRLGGKVAVYRMRALDSFQIDEPGDWELFEALLTARQSPTAPPAWDTIRGVVFDFDGVFTDNLVSVSETGEETVRCSRADGLGLALIKEAGVSTLVLSTETNPVVSARCRKLGMEFRQGERDKLATLQRWVGEKGWGRECVAYVGNDLNDLACLRWAGLPIAVADAEPAVRAAARWVTKRNGGHGAVREICDAILRQKGAETTYGIIR